MGKKFAEKKETNPTKKQELENKINEINQKIKNLGSSTIPPTPKQGPPTKNPSKTSRQLTVKCNGAVGGKWEYINITNSQEKVLIDTKNEVFYSDDALYIKGNQYVITFNEEDAQKKGNNFIFDENNDKFQLTSPAPQPSNKLEMEIKISIFISGEEYVKFSNLIEPNDWDNGKKKPVLISISKKNPVWEGKNWDEIDWKKAPNFKISFLGKDASQFKKENTGWGEKDNYYFDESNQKFTLTPLGNWPSDDPKPTPKTPPYESKKKIILRTMYLFPVGTEYYCFMEEVRDNQRRIFINQKNPSVNGALKKSAEYEISFELDLSSEIHFKTTKIKFFGKDDSIKVVEV